MTNQLKKTHKQVGGPLTDSQGVAEAGPFSYGAKKPRKGTVAYYIAQQRKELDKRDKPIEPLDQRHLISRLNGMRNGKW